MTIYRHIRGSTLKIRVVVNIATLDSAKTYIKKASGESVLPESDMIKEADGVYIYKFPTTSSMELITYNVYTKVSLGESVTIDKTSFVLIED